MKNLFFIVLLLAVAMTAGCVRENQISAVTPLPPPDTVPPAPTILLKTPAATRAPATVEIMTQSGTCQSNKSVLIEGTIQSTASGTVNAVVRATLYDKGGIKQAPGSDLINIDPKGTGTFRIVVHDGCIQPGWTYYVWIDTVQ